MTKMVYIAGPMRGYENNNSKAFENAEIDLNLDGFYVVNPTNMDSVFHLHHNDEGIYKRVSAAMQAELAAIPFCDAIYLLEGWEKSEGARAELKVALEHSLEIMVEKKNNDNGEERKN